MKSIHLAEYRKVINKLRIIREESGVTQEQLASMLGIKQTIISKIETCERRLDIIELRNVCKVLNISLIDFVNDIEKILNND